MIIREIKKEDSENFLKFLKTLDNESSFMLYEPLERKTTVLEMENNIDSTISSGSIIYILEEEEICGYVLASRGRANKNKHSAYIVIGILEKTCNKGYGRKLLTKIEQWAKINMVTRLELTVMENNKPALALYKKMGYEIEGRKVNSLKMKGEFVNEFYMGKII